MGLCFTGTWNNTSINFLDIILTGDIDRGTVITLLYKKPMAGNTILPANSCHRRHTMAIPKGKYIRAKRACTNEQYLQKELNKIDNRLVELGYPKWMLKKARNDIKKLDRKNMLFKNKGTSETSNLVFSTAYSIHFGDVKIIFLNIFRCSSLIYTIIQTFGQALK